MTGEEGRNEVNMKLAELCQKLSLEAQTQAGKLDQEVTGGYASDLLSCVMAKAQAGNVWITIQSHSNIVAVASLLNLAGVIITEGNRPDPETVARADKEGVVLMITPKATFTVVGELTRLGVRGESQDSG